MDTKADSRPHGGKATIVQHSAVFGHSERLVRQFRVEDVQPYAQYPCSVTVVFILPRERRRNYFTITPDNLAYLTIEVAGEVVYDSRVEVPCDMAQWEATWTRFKGKPPMSTVRM